MSSRPAAVLNRYFGLDARGSTVGRELRGAFATYLTMAYILLANAQILKGAGVPYASCVACTSAPLPKFGGTMDIMRVTIQLPDDISAALEEQWDDVPRRSLEAIAVEAYRSGALTESQIRRLLGLESRFQVHALLKQHNVPLQYTVADLEDDLKAQRELGILPSR